MDTSTCSGTDVSSDWEFVYSTCEEFLNFASASLFGASSNFDQVEVQEDGISIMDVSRCAHSSKKLESLLKEVDLILDRCEQSDELDDPFLNSVKASIDDVKSLRKEIVKQIEICSKDPSFSPPIAPPTYEEAISTTSSTGSDRHEEVDVHPSRMSNNLCTTSSSSSDHHDEADGPSRTSNNLSYSELGNMLENLKTETHAQSAQLIYSCDNVTLYFISPTGSVSVNSGSETVRIFEIEDGNKGTLPKYYLQVYIFVYPLVPQVSPCVRTEFGAILFPNINIDQSDETTDVQSIGLIVPEDHEEEFTTCLENILQTKIVLCDTTNPERTSSKISSAITTSAECLSKFLIQVAEKAEEFMDDNTPKLIDKMNPATRQRRVSPCMTNGIKIAKDVTAVTAGITGFVASKVGAATYSLGQFLAPHIKEKGSKLLVNTAGVDESTANKKIDTVLDITAGAFEGIGTVYQGLAQSARIFGRSLSCNTVQIVKHKFGEPAAEFTKDTFETVSNGVEIGTSLRFFKPSKIAKTAAVSVIINARPGTSDAAAVEQNSSVTANCTGVVTFPTETSSQVSSSSISNGMDHLLSDTEVLQPTVISQYQPVVHHQPTQSPAQQIQLNGTQDLLL